MSVHFLSSPYQGTVDLLPEGERGAIGEKTARLMASRVEYIATNHPYVYIMGGVIVAVAGLFLILAYQEILPAQINAVSRLGKPSAAFCGCFQGAGLVAVLIGIVSANLIQKEEAKISDDPYRTEAYVTGCYFARQLKPHDLLILDNPIKKQLIITYLDRSQIPEIQQTFIPYTSNPEQSFQTWSQKNPTITWNAHCVIVDSSKKDTFRPRQRSSKLI